VQAVVALVVQDKTGKELAGLAALVDLHQFLVQLSFMPVVVAVAELGRQLVPEEMAEMGAAE
jgi:hypothetical protein